MMLGRQKSEQSLFMEHKRRRKAPVPLKEHKRSLGSSELYKDIKNNQYKGI